jgi:hypothetical protein
MSVWCPHSIDYDAGIIAGLVRKSGKSKLAAAFPLTATSNNLLCPSSDSRTDAPQWLMKPVRVFSQKERNLPQKRTPKLV